MYYDQRSTILAVDNLNGATVLGRMIRVDHTLNYKQMEEDKETGKLKERENQSLVFAFTCLIRSVRCSRLPDGMYELIKSPFLQICGRSSKFRQRYRRIRCRIRNLFTAELRPRRSYGRIHPCSTSRSETEETKANHRWRRRRREQRREEEAERGAKTEAGGEGETERSIEWEEGDRRKVEDER